MARYIYTGVKCKVSGCNRPAKVKGMCLIHYNQRWSKLKKKKLSTQ